MRERLTYSHLVAWAKVILPLTALAILATLFLVPREMNLEQAVPFAKVELEKRLRDQQITAPAFSTQTPQGHNVSVTASAAHPDADDPSRTVAENVSARIDTLAGDTILVDAVAGEMDSTFKEVVLDQGVRIATGDGLQIDTETMIMSVDEVRAETEGFVTATTGIGQLEAGRMAIRPADESGAVYLFFTNGVRLLYTPETTTR